MAHRRPAGLPARAARCRDLSVLPQFPGSSRSSLRGKSKLERNPAKWKPAPQHLRDITFPPRGLLSSGETWLGWECSNGDGMNKTLDAASPSPLQDGFFWPAEWEPHRRTWICWPARAECFGGAEGILRAKQAYARVARALSAFEPVALAVRPQEAAEARLATGGKVEI